MANSYHTTNGRTSKRGAFIGGIWHCDCEPRLPADKFQTKNGGKNHGRWFYTCQKPQHKRCKFFLWTDDAKLREEAAVLGNSRSEPTSGPKTPQKATTSNAVPPTPQTKSNSNKPGPLKNAGDMKEVGNLEHEESFDLSSSNDEELLKAEQVFFPDKPPFETPKKAPRTDSLTSPGKRTHGQMTGKTNVANDTWPLSDDVFATPTTSNKSGSTGLLSPSNTPAKGLSQPVPPLNDDLSPLAAEALKILTNIQLSSKVETDLVDLLNKHDLRTQGIIKGRDITRLAVQAKEKKIAELQARISTLEAERDTNRRVITHLKHDMSSSPKKGRGRGLPPSGRSEV